MPGQAKPWWPEPQTRHDLDMLQALCDIHMEQHAQGCAFKDVAQLGSSKDRRKSVCFWPAGDLASRRERTAKITLSR